MGEALRSAAPLLVVLVLVVLVLVLVVLMVLVLVLVVLVLVVLVLVVLVCLVPHGSSLLLAQPPIHQHCVIVPG
ncbi:unnamed protein product [Merluccius merluccius]